MSRWINQFKNHAFWQSWKGIEDLLNKIEPSNPVNFDISQEIARIRKVIAFINDWLECCDPELIQPNLWNEFNEQTSPCFNHIQGFLTEKNLGRLQNANSHLDRILGLIRPAFSNGKSAAIAAGKAFREYANTIEASIRDLKKITQEDIASIKTYQKQAEGYCAKMMEANKKIVDLENYLFVAKEETPSISAQINTMYKKIVDYHQKLTTGNEQEASIILQVDKAKKDILEDIKKTRGEIALLTDEINEIDSFYVKIFGSPSKEDATILVGGLKQELAKRQDELDKFKIHQETKYKALIAEIESLLPGATSAGLASSYGALRRSFSRPIKIYTYVFYGTLFGLFVCSLPFVIEAISFWPFSIQFLKYQEWHQLPVDILHKLPLIIPILWITLFASSRRSEALRLQQEYAHKEAIAKSFESFKKQIHELSDESNEKEALMSKLLGVAIDAISFNASITLDGKHKDKTPFDSLTDPISKIVTHLSKHGFSIDIKNQK